MIRLPPGRHHLGGLDFAVTADGFNTIDQPVCCAAWMVPCVPDDASKESLMYGTDHCTFDFNFAGASNIMCLVYPILKVSTSSSGHCYVKIIDGKHYAIIKRGLL